MNHKFNPSLDDLETAEFLAGAYLALMELEERFPWKANGPHDVYSSLRQYHRGEVAQALRAASESLWRVILSGSGGLNEPWAVQARKLVHNHREEEERAKNQEKFDSEALKAEEALDEPVPGAFYCFNDDIKE